MLAFLAAGLGFASPLVARSIARTSAPRIASTAILASPDAPTITYRKVFKSSYPEFVEIKINESGRGTFDMRQLDEEANRQPFEVNASLAAKIFGLAAKLHNFQGVDLDVHRRIANLGEKTLRYDKGAETHEVKFNYTLDESAGQLMAIFEGLARQAMDLSDLERTMRYDRLGVNDVLQQIEQDYNNKQFPEPERLLPALDQLAADDKFIDIARQRARTLANKIRSSR
jgi:prephenate dehydratase